LKVSGIDLDCRDGDPALSCGFCNLYQGGFPMATQRHALITAVVPVVLMAASFILELAHASPNGRIRFSGDPLTGGQDCTVCHQPGAVVPNVVISGPAVVNANTTNQYTVTVSGGPAQTAGVNISVSNADQFVGQLNSIGSDLQLLFSELTHTAPKIFTGGSSSFTFSWTAPPNNGTVTMYAAGNSANADGNLTGDGVDTVSFNITVQNGTNTPPTPPPAPNTQITLQQYVTGLDRPVVIANTGMAGDARLLVAEQIGRIRVVDAGGVLRPTAFLDITGRVDSNGNEKGLLGLAFHPEYASNGHFFVNYTRAFGTGFRTRISRFTVTADRNVANPNSELVLLEYAQPFANHNGGDIHFGPDGYLYIASGDGGSQGDPQNNAQNNLRLLGKLLRIDVDDTVGSGPDCDISGNQNYTIPPGNAFADGVGGAGCDEVWAKGLRNPWRFSFDREAGDLWVADVGQNAFEEVNYTPVGTGAASNYGWRCFEANAPFNTAGCPPSGQLTFPVHAFAHSDGDNCSVTGGYVYRGSDFPNLVGQYFFTDFCNASIRALSGPPTSPTVTVVLPTAQSITLPATFGEDSRGELYVASHGSNAIFRVIGTSDPGNIVFEDDFETNKGWLPNQSGDTATAGRWERANPEGTTSGGVTTQLGTTNSGSFDLVTEGTAGASAGVNDIDGGLTSIRSPNIALPAGETLTLSFAYYLAHLNNATNADFLRVTVVGSTSRVVFEELGAADNDSAVWNTFSTDISSFAGQTVTILVQAADAGTGSLVEAAIDDVVISSGGSGGTTILNAGFDSGTDGFSYGDDRFRATTQPAYASGVRVATGGNPGAALQVSLGGIDNNVINGMSGGWTRSFTLTAAANVTLAFDYNLTQQPDYESGEFSEVLATVDGRLFVAATVQGNGNGGTPVTTGWRTFSMSLGTLPAGNHTLVIGGFNNQKTLANESTTILIDDVVLTAP
jgi:glucose/arabinose dehydrogenase